MPRGSQRKTPHHRRKLSSLDSQALGHLIVEEALAGAIRLDPVTIDHKLRDGTLAGTLDDFVNGTGGGLDVNFFVGDVVLGQKSLGLTAVGTPSGRIDGKFHESILLGFAISQTCSRWGWVRSLTTLPVLSVEAGSKSMIQTSSSATGRCSTSRGTMMNSPCSIHSWRSREPWSPIPFSRNSMRKRPFTT